MAKNIVTKLNKLINPEVMGDMISAQLPNAIKFAGIAPIDNTLEGQPGDTITIPKYGYIGDAEDVAEAGPIPYAEMTTTVGKHTVKKAGIGVKLSDEAVLSGYGDPVGEATKQIAMSIASKIDNDTLDAIKAAPFKLPANTPVNLDLIDLIEAKFIDDVTEYEDSEITGVLFLNPKDASKLRKEAAGDWTRASQLGDNILVKGAYGECLGWVIVRAKKVEQGQFYAVKAGALGTYVKRGLMAEKDRDIDNKLTKFNADQHYVVAIKDESKIVVSTPKTT